MTQVDLATDLGELTLANPVMVAAGCGGSGRELVPYGDLGDLGALVTRSVTLDPQAGGVPPRAVESVGGLLNDAGPQGPGLQTFLATDLPWLAQQRVRTVVSVAGASLGEWTELARRVGLSPGLSGIEVNLAWPAGRLGRDSYQAGKVLAAVRRDVPRGVPVLAKIPAELPHAVDVARSVVKEGADAVVVAAAVPGLVLDESTLRPALGSGGGTLSGPALHAVVLRALWELHTALPGVPLVGSGGVRNGFDALAMLAAGARAVQVGTALLHDPTLPGRIVTGLTDELARRGFPSVAAAVGSAHRPTDPTGEL